MFKFWRRKKETPVTLELMQLYRLREIVEQEGTYKKVKQRVNNLITTKELKNERNNKAKS